MKAESEEFVISDRSELSETFKAIEDRYDKNGRQFVTVKNDNTDMHGRLRRLYFHFVGQIIETTGNIKEDEHFNYKFRFLISIFTRDGDAHPMHIDVIKNMKIIKLQQPEMFASMRDLVVEGTHLKDASEEEFREYIRSVEDDGIKLGVRFKLSRYEQELWGVK